MEGETAVIVQPDAAAESIAADVVEQITPAIAEAIAEATEEDDTLWVRELLKEEFAKFQTALLLEMTARYSPIQVTLESLARIVETQSAALAVAAANPTPEPSSSLPQALEPVAEIVEPTTAAVENAGVPEAPKIEAPRKRHRKI